MRTVQPESILVSSLIILRRVRSLSRAILFEGFANAPSKFWFDRVLIGKKHSKKTPKLSLKMGFGGISWGWEAFSSGWYSYRSLFWTEFSHVNEPWISAAQEPPEQRTPQLPEAIRIAISALCRSSNHICLQMNRWILMCGNQQQVLYRGWIWWWIISVPIVRFSDIFSTTLERTQHLQPTKLW